MAASEVTERTTIPVFIGSPKHPLIVQMASTGYAGIKGNSKGKGTIFILADISKEAVDAFEELPEIAKLISEKKAEIAAINAPLNATLASPDLPEEAKENIRKDLHVWKDWKSVKYVDPSHKDGNYDLVKDENGNQVYQVKLTQASIAQQLAGGKNGAKPTPLDKIIYVKHIVKNTATGKISNRLVDANKRPLAKQTFGGGEIVVKVNTKMTKRPSQNVWSLTMARLVEVYHITEGSLDSMSQAINSLDEDFFGAIEDFVQETASDNADASTNEASQRQTESIPQDPAGEEDNPYAVK